MRFSLFHSVTLCEIFYRLFFHFYSITERHRGFKIVGGFLRFRMVPCRVPIRLSGNHTIIVGYLAFLQAHILPIPILKIGGGEGVAPPDFGGGTVVQDHVHLGERGGGIVHLLPVDGQIAAGLPLGFVVSLQEE